MAWFRRRSAARDRSAGTEAAVRRALLAVLERDFAGAEETLARALRRDSRAIPLYLALARLYRERGEVGRAIQIHQNLLLRRDVGARDRLTALAELADDFHRGGFLRRAIAAYEEVLSHDARHRDALAALVELLVAVREHERAIGMLRRLGRVEGSRDEQREAALWVRVAETAHAEGRSRDARRALKKARRLEPANADAAILQGVLEAERGRDKAALSAWKEVPRRSPERAREIYPRLEATFAALDRGKEYESYLRELLRQRPEDAEARLALARHLASRGETEAALGELRPLLGTERAAIEARVAVGRILLAEHRDKEAVEEYRALLDALEERPRSDRREA